MYLVQDLVTICRSTSRLIFEKGLTQENEGENTERSSLLSVYSEPGTMLCLVKSSVYHHALATAIMPILQMREQEVAE